MSDDIKKDRSPNYPKMPLSEAIELVKKLYAKAGKAQIKPEVAVGPLGYSGLNGAALGTLGTLNQYGLIDRERGEGIAVSPLAIRLIHPTSPAQEAESKREAMQKPRIFQEIAESGHDQCSEEVLASHLIQQGFTPEGAKKVAAVFVSNKTFADSSKTDTGKESTSQINTPEPLRFKRFADHVSPENSIPALKPTKTLLAQYSIPLGANEAVLAFHGDTLNADDFDALAEYVQLFKKQFERKQRSAAPIVTAARQLPSEAIWKNKHSDKPVTIVQGPIAHEDGRLFYFVDDGTGIPASELEWK